ncbi:MAG: flagellin lysine-N-methylase [Nitrospinae bacterium]|nr:flagellin lysine-N-methylase [Nitrospinota bacterium]
MDGKIAVPAYMADFACLGGECDMTCCRVWDVPYDDAAFDRLQSAMSRDEWAATLKNFRAPDVEIKGAKSIVKLRPDGYCVFFDDKGLCSIQGKYGEMRLGDVCAKYPRQFIGIGNRIEMVGCLSCPEAVRGLIAKGAAHVAVKEPSSLPRPDLLTLKHFVDTSSASLYQSAFDDVRGVLLQLLQDASHPLDTRLFLASYFASRTSTFFRKGAGREHAGKLAVEIKNILSSAAQMELKAGFDSISFSSKLAVSTIRGVLEVRAKTKSVFPEYVELIGKIADHYAGESSSDALWKAYEGSKSAAPQSVRDYFDRLLGNYCAEHLLSTPYIVEEELLSYIVLLLLRVAALRFIFYSHPDIYEFQHEVDKIPEEDFYGRLAVKTVVFFTKNLEHNLGYMEEVKKALGGGGMFSLAHAAVFIRM